MPNERTIAEQLKRLRALKQVTQGDVADMLNVKRQTYSAYERCVSIPDAITLKKLADYFGVTTDYIVDEPRPDDSATRNVKKERLTVEDALDGLGITNEEHRKAFTEIAELMRKAENNAEIASEIEGFGLTGNSRA